MVNLQQLMSPVRRAIDDFKMISAGDKIAVGLSGGKDSIAMLSALAGLKRFYPNPFEIVAIRIDTGIGYNEQEELALKTYVESLGVTYHVEKTEIYQVVFEERKEKNPCSLCANMRRGALNQTAKNLGCNKVCLGHHADDLIETFFLSMIYEGRLSTFQPVTYLSKADISVNIYAFLKAQKIGEPVSLCCAIGDETIDGKPYSEIVQIAREFIADLGGFEAFAEWGIF